MARANVAPRVPVDSTSFRTATLRSCADILALPFFSSSSSSSDSSAVLRTE